MEDHGNTAWLEPIKLFYGRPQWETMGIPLGGSPLSFSMGDHSGRPWETTLGDHGNTGQNPVPYVFLWETTVGDHGNTGQNPLPYDFLWETTRETTEYRSGARL